MGANFNSTKVQFGEGRKGLLARCVPISIPLRYNLERYHYVDWITLSGISIPLRYNLERAGRQAYRNRADFNSTKVQFGGSLSLSFVILRIYFNSTKVQFGAVKLDRKYHINKGFEKRFR